MKEIILTICCPTSKGTIFRITELLFKIDALIVDSNHYSDQETGQFFMRLHMLFTTPMPKKEFFQHFEHIQKKLSLQMQVHDTTKKVRALILCSKESHCLIDLLSRIYRGSLNMIVPKIISNHENLSQVASWHGIEYLHLPVSKENRREQEKQIETVVKNDKIDLIILARYMQILSFEFCQKFKDRCINIHHSFLPSFKGANPYQQAYDRGVKMIGATSHFVTSDLDEGPILFQEAVSVTHKHTYQEFKEMGKNVETRVLASAVESFVDKRIFTNGRKTVIL